MDWVQLTSYMAVSTLFAVAPGPNTLLVVRSVSTSGLIMGFANNAGIATAFLVHGVLSLIGIPVLLTSSENALLVVKLLGAVYLCNLGIKALIDARNGVADEIEDNTNYRRRSIIAGFRCGFVTNLLNPNSLMFFLAAFPQFIDEDSSSSSLQSSSLIMIHIVITALWLALVICGFDRIAKAAKSDRFNRWLNALSGVALIGFGTTFAATSN